jgi:hypothetical protein
MPRMRRQLLPLSPHAFHAYQIFLTFKMKERSVATNQEWRPDYPDQAVRVLTDSTLMGSFPCYSLFSHNMSK